MKILLLSAAICLIASPAFAQSGRIEKTDTGANFENLKEILRKNPTCSFSSCSNLKTYSFSHSEEYNNDNEIITVATRVGHADTAKVTAPVSILTMDEIRDRNQGVVADLLRTIPGLSVSQNGGAGSLTQIRLRGSEANHIVVIIDGVEVANPADGAFDFGGLRTEDIVKIEVLRGEQSALYGSDAVGGVINIITRAGSTSESWSASVEGGSRDTFEGQVSAVIPVGDAALTLSGNAFTTDGFDISGLGGETDGAKSRAINIGLNNIDVGPISFSGKFGSTLRETNFDSDTDSDGRLNNTNDGTEVTTETARIDARFELAEFDHKLTAHMVETDTDTVGGFSSRSIGSRHVANWAAKRDFNDNHSFTALVEAEHEQYEIRPNFTEAGAEPDNWTYGIAGDYRFNADEITLTASARHDINDLFEDATTWRVGAGYGFDWNGRVRASVGTGVKNPTLIELFGFFPASRFVGNPDLESETSLGVSIGYEQSIGNLDLSLDLFRSELKNEITGSGNSVINLSTDSRREGVELTANWSLDETLNVQGSASFLNSEQDDIEEIRRPKILASATATWTPMEKLALTLSIDHTGSQRDNRFFFDPTLLNPFSGNLGSFTSENLKLESFTLVGANTRYHLTDNVAITLRGSNLLNETYQEIIGYASPGRAIFGGLELDF